MTALLKESESPGSPTSTRLKSFCEGDPYMLAPSPCRLPNTVGSSPSHFAKVEKDITFVFAVDTSKSDAASADDDNTTQRARSVSPLDIIYDEGAGDDNEGEDISEETDGSQAESILSTSSGVLSSSMFGSTILAAAKSADHISVEDADDALSFCEDDIRTFRRNKADKGFLCVGSNADHGAGVEDEDGDTWSLSSCSSSTQGPQRTRVSPTPRDRKRGGRISPAMGTSNSDVSTDAETPSPSSSQASTSSLRAHGGTNESLHASKPQSAAFKEILANAMRQGLVQFGTNMTFVDDESPAQSPTTAKLEAHEGDERKEKGNGGLTIELINTPPPSMQTHFPSTPSSPVVTHTSAPTELKSAMSSSSASQRTGGEGSQRLRRRSSVTFNDDVSVRTIPSRKITPVFAPKPRAIFVFDDVPETDGSNAVEADVAGEQSQSLPPVVRVITSCARSPNKCAQGVRTSSSTQPSALSDGKDHQAAHCREGKAQKVAELATTTSVLDELFYTDEDKIEHESASNNQGNDTSGGDRNTLSDERQGICTSQRMGKRREAGKSQLRWL